jgi:hypothetical protein
VEVDRELLARPTAPANKPPLDEEQEVEGLGRLPAYVQSVTDLLLFNTQDNPYKKYVSLDNLTGIKKKKEREAPRKKKLGAAPKTITDGDELVRPPRPPTSHSASEPGAPDPRAHIHVRVHWYRTMARRRTSSSSRC